MNSNKESSFKPAVQDFSSTHCLLTSTDHKMSSTTTTITHPDGTTVSCTTSTAPAPAAVSGEVKLMYFPISGRGELTRLICAMGGIKVTETFPGMAEYKPAVSSCSSGPA